jgi:peroxiredoxin
MKHPILMALALIPFLSIAQNTGYRLTVRLNGLKPQAKAWLVYEYGMSDQKTLDSANAKNGVFTFHGTAGDPLVKASLIVAHAGGPLPGYNTHPDTRVIYLEEGHISFAGVTAGPGARPHVTAGPTPRVSPRITAHTADSIRTARVVRGPVNRDYTAYDAAVLSRMQLLGDQVNATYKAASPQQQQDSAFKAQLFAVFKTGMKVRDSLSVVWIQHHPGSWISLVVLRGLAGKNIDVSRIEPLFNGLSDSLRMTEQGKDFAAAINSARFTSIGSMAPDFTENDTNDQPVKLSDFKGRYVLLDFWASWCGPCRAENPNVVKAYNTYKDKNFTVLSVSLDQPGKRDAWLNAIHADSLTWTQVSDLKFWNNTAAKLYSIKAIPQNFLIDPSGRIIGRNLRGSDLEKKLGEVL